MDGTDRLRCRSVEYEAQKVDFSGKHKVHTIKNTVICDEVQFIHFLGDTWRGAIHDKTRGFRLEKFDHVIEIAVGLHNLRVTRRKTTYARATDRVRANLQIQLT